MALPTLTLRPDGIVDIDFRADCDLEPSTLRALHAHRLSIAPQKRAAIWRIEGHWPTGPAGRQFGTSKVVADYTIAAAFVGGWAGNETLIDLFILEAKPPFPVRYFKEVEPAVQWLYTLL
jgi:hypothetical protein